MSNEVPPTLNYGTPPPPTTTKHDHIYTTLLAVLAFLMLMGVVSIAGRLHQANLEPQMRAMFGRVAIMEGCFLAVTIAVILVRILLPNYRRWPTFGLNVILLLFIPFGTALSIYAFMRVDKKLPHSPTA